MNVMIAYSGCIVKRIVEIIILTKVQYQCESWNKCLSQELG